ncbi:YheV family putative metal-binding protein [Cellvibrio sp. KY-GH-1]|uniref:YheV family putative zinc ribbon protein n=1 Tax=Cellvibrio sp. KY-GH-1 TaxID=2303332 RepID=UPI001248C2E5|nr:YheV family putative zinc ribbon protein [Cellvibrio sp. KY-GH-1]QEY17751.1 YheV family putative metal-binding protein [Cellvibrio sp. KY-GH-1]
MVYSSKRRFVAGAVCPRCSEMDKLVVYSEDGKDYRECVACGYKDEMHFKPVARELETRVNQTEEDKRDAVQVINILPFKSPDQ